MKVRRCRRDDLDAVERLQADWEAEGITHGYARSARRELEELLGDTFLVLEVDGAVRGYATAKVCESEGLAVLPAGVRYLRIEDLYVAPGVRNRGAGSRLLRGLLDAARERGVHRFRVLSASRDLDAVLRFYRRHGFRTWYAELFV